MDLYVKAKDLGIMTEYIDGQGHHRVTDPAALKAILDALPPQAPRRLADLPVVIRTGHPARTELAPSAQPPVAWKITAGGKILAEGKAADRTVVWPQELPVGIHRLHLRDAGAAEQELPLLVAPARAFDGDFDRCWLLAVQLYAVRSGSNWGMAISAISGG